MFRHEAEYKKTNFFKTFFYLILIIKVGAKDYIFNEEYQQYQSWFIYLFQSNQYTCSYSHQLQVSDGKKSFGLESKQFPQIKTFQLVLTILFDGRIPNPYGYLSYYQSNSGYVLIFLDDKPYYSSNCIGLPFKYAITFDQEMKFKNPINKFTFTFDTGAYPGEPQLIDKFEIHIKEYACNQEGCFDCADNYSCNPNGCLTGFTLTTMNDIQPNQQVCVKNCSSGMTKNITRNPLVQVCVTCPQDCLNCTDNNNCLQCKPGYYFNSDQNACKFCLDGCSSCDQNKSCTGCLSGYSLAQNPTNNALQYCQKNCLAGQYNHVIDNNSMTQECSNCIHNCQSCTGPDNCSNCLSGYGYNSQLIQCLCTEGCSYCDQNVSCANCVSGYTQTTNPNNIKQKYCKKTCELGNYLQITNYQTMAQSCNLCLPNCVQCSSNNQCDYCKENYDFIQQIPSCLLKCMNNQYRDRTNNYSCTNCITNCLQCIDGQSCSQCDDNYEFIQQEQKCLLKCQSNQYRDIQKHYVCTNCVDNCTSCSDGQSCTTCKDNYEYVSQPNKCLQKCQQNQFRDLTQNYLCQNCHSSCKTCIGSAINQCSSCYTGWYTLGSYCYQWCPNNFKADSTLWQCIECQEYKKPDCQVCANTCKSCQYQQSEKCLDCYDSMTIQGNTCVCKNHIDNRGIFYECSYNQVAVLQATLAIDTPTLTIDFGVPLTQIPNVQCQNIFQNSTLQFGSQSDCSIQDTQIKVQLGQDALIMENDILSFIPDVLSYQISHQQKINKFYLTKVQQKKNDLKKPQVNIEFSNTQNTCYDIVFSVADTINDAQRGFLSFSWSISASPSLDQNIQQQVNNIVSNANSQKSTSLVILKQLIPASTKITASFEYLLKVNSSQNLQFTTTFLMQKDIVIKFDSQSNPIYRFRDLLIYVSFYTQICDQSGAIITNEPLNIQISSQSVPLLNQNLSQYKYNQTLVTVKKYAIPQNRALDLNVNASLVSEKNIVNLKSYTITPSISDLFIQIIDGQKGSFSFKKSLNLTGLARDLELEDSKQDQGINLKWDCISLTSNQNDNKCYDYKKNIVVLQQNVAALSIPGSTFNPYQVLQFTFSGKKDNREKSQYVVVFLSELDIPNLIVQYQDESQLIKVNINQDIDATLLYDSDISSDLLSYAGAILYNNTIVGAVKFDFYQVRFRVWDYFINILPEIPIVQVRFSAYNPYYIMPSLSITNFNINLPPKNCVLTINTPNGQALQTIFKIEMSGCTSVNTPISYQFFYYLNDTDFQQEKIYPNNILRRQIMDLSLQNSFYTILPSGNLTIMAQAIDSFLAVYNTTILINVQPLAQNENQVNENINKALKIDSSQTTNQFILNLCMLGEEISRKNPVYNLDSVNIKKSQLIQLIISQTNSLPSTSLLSTYANKVIAQLQQSITNQQESDTIIVLNQLNIILQNQQSVINSKNIFMNNNNVFLQNIVDSFKVLNSTTQNISNKLISQQLNISDQICNYLSLATLPNQGGVQLQGNLISLDCQQITSKNLKQVIFDYKEPKTVNVYNLGQTIYSRNPFEQTPEFQNYTQQLKQQNSSIIITENPVIKYSIDVVNASSNRLLYEQNSNFAKMSNVHSNRKLVDSDQKQNNQSNVYMFTFQNLQPSSNNQTCLQKQQYIWQSDGCNYIKKDNKYFCYCKSTNPTTVTDDLKQLLINKNVKAAFSQDGIRNISNFEIFYEYAIVWTLVFITFLQYGLYRYGKNLDKKFSKSFMSQIMPEPVLENPPITEKNQTPSLKLQSIEELNQVIEKQRENQNQQILIKSKNQRQSVFNIQTNIKIEKKESQQIQLNQIPESLDSFKNQQPQIFDLDKPYQLKEIDQPKFLVEKNTNQDQLNELQEQQNQQINSNKITLTTFQDQNSVSNLINQGIKLTPYELECIKQFKKLSLLVQFKVLHAYFNVIYTYEPDLSRPIRFNLIYLRLVHSLCLSTVFDQSYNISQQIVISIVSSIIVVVGVFFVTIAHKIARIGQKLSAFFMVCLLLFYYYVILAVVSNEEPSYANSKYVSFFLVIGVDFVLVQSVLSLLKITILKNIQSHTIFYKLYSIFGLDKLVASLTI